MPSATSAVTLGALTPTGAGAYTTGTAPVSVAARTNYLLNSQNLAGTGWFFSQSGTGTGVTPTVTANAGTAPDGTATAARFTISQGAGTTSSDYQYLGQSFNMPVNAGQQHVFSVWLRSTDGASSYQIGIGTSGTIKLVTVTGVWQRFFFNGANLLSLNTTTQVRMQVRGGTGSSTSADLLGWGGQLEAASSPSTLMPTGASTTSGNASPAVQGTYATAGPAAVVGLALQPNSAGTLSFSGVGAALLGALLLGSQATSTPPLFQAASSPSLGLLATLGSGTLSIPGAAALSLSPLTPLSSGELRLIGAASSILATLAGLGAGTATPPLFQGASGATFSALVALLAGTRNPSGAASTVLFSPVAQGAGLLSFPGTAAFSLGVLLAQSSGELRLIGAALLSLAALRGQAVGVHTPPLFLGAGSGVLAGLLADLSGTRQPSAASGLTLALLTGQGAGLLAFPGSGSPALGRLLPVASGELRLLALGLLDLGTLQGQGVGSHTAPLFPATGSAALAGLALLGQGGVVAYLGAALAPLLALEPQATGDAQPPRFSGAVALLLAALGADWRGEFVPPYDPALARLELQTSLAEGLALQTSVALDLALSTTLTELYLLALTLQETP